MNKYIFWTLPVIFITISSPAQKPPQSFSVVWSKINASSPALESSRRQAESLTESQARATHHWLPKVYVDAKSYEANDPGASFFGLLEQRSLTQSDFNPDLINQPDRHVYTRGALGFDWPLYEGGMKVSQVELFKHSVAAQNSTTSQIQIEQYSTVGQSYGSIVVLQEQQKKLQTLSSEISRMMKGYQLGNKSNPVGYSGLLGMKSLANRITGLMNQYEAQSRSYYAMLSEMGLKDSNWSPEVLDSNAFVNKYFSVNSKSKADLESFKINSAKENAKASAEMANMEKAKFLPRFGAFAETYVFNGNRKTDNGYNAGLYLQWNLYDPSEQGRHKEATLKTISAEKFSEAIDQQERAERAGLYEQIKTLRENMNLINDSHSLLVEQSKMTETLFKNGSINALQIVEVLSRRADLISQQTEAELAFIKASSQVITKQKFEIEINLASGAQNEKQ